MLRITERRKAYQWLRSGHRRFPECATHTLDMSSDQEFSNLFTESVGLLRSMRGGVRPFTWTGMSGTSRNWNDPLRAGPRSWSADRVPTRLAHVAIGRSHDYRPMDASSEMPLT